MTSLQDYNEADRYISEAMDDLKKYRETCHAHGITPEENPISIIAESGNRYNPDDLAESQTLYSKCLDELARGFYIERTRDRILTKMHLAIFRVDTSSDEDFARFLEEMKQHLDELS